MSPRRGTLGGLIQQAPDNAPAALPPPPPDSGGPKSGSSEDVTGGAVRDAESVTSVLRKSRRTNSRTPDLPTPEVRTSEVPTSQGPKYLQLERKDTLLWPRQLNELTVLRRVLNRRKPKGEGERITENTLIRVAIDLLIANASQLRGGTEDELRRSLGLGD